MTFQSVNRKSSPRYDPGLQRHHFLPKQILGKRYFSQMFASVGTVRVGFDDFRFNGLLLPATEKATLETGLPLHRGPHPIYNELVIERVGTIESRWAQVKRKNPEIAREEALERMRLLQRALRLRLITEEKTFVLNRNDPLGTGFDFATLDAMAETIWKST
ncbi:AHH domain-containing protein [Erythrobacter sp. SCSIO 43205]|nr:AHH domain-containing protein [Erythrobacter sp. SCSIO 43205]